TLQSENMMTSSSDLFASGLPSSFFSSRRRHTRCLSDWSSDVCSSDLGAVKAVDYMKSALVESHRERWRRIESGQLTVVGMNRFASTEPSPLTADADGGILVVDPQVEAEQRAALEQWRSERDHAA